MNEKEKQEYLEYILSRKSSSKHNYHKECLKELEKFQSVHSRKPRVLLHVCCIVCACWPIQFLLENGCEVALYYYNPNIYPEEEYQHRLAEIKRYIHERYQDSIPVIEGEYTYPVYESTVLKNRSTDPEGWKSCFGCYADRMKNVFQYGQENGFDYFTTVMTFSRQKDSQKLNEIGLQLDALFQDTKYLVSDFKKANGALISAAICDEYNIYRQSYCGCRYSKLEREQANSD